VHARRLQLIFAGALLALSALLIGHGPAAARSSQLASLSVAADATAAPPALQYLGGFGGRLAGVAVNGTVAYVGEGSSLTLLDITDPAHPARYARLPLDGVVEDITLAGERLYVAGTRGLQIFDVRSPAAAGSSWRGRCCSPPRIPTRQGYRSST